MILLDSISEVIGVSTRERLSRNLARRAVNCDLRDGISQRSRMLGMSVKFEEGMKTADSDHFLRGNVQGFYRYEPYGTRPGGFVCLIGGTVYFAGIAGRWLFVKKVFEGLHPAALHGWIEQAYQWVFIQDGINPPVIWDGTNDAFQADQTKQELPTGAMMRFIHHRLAVVSADGNDQIAISDLWTTAESENVWKFTESGYWGEAGLFGLHANFGRIMGLEALPASSSSPNGQSGLLVMGSKGFQTINLQRRRTEWLDSQIIDTALPPSNGLASFSGFQTHNQSVWYVSSDGLRELRRERQMFQTDDDSSTQSEDIEGYWRVSDENLRKHLPLGSHDDKILMGLMPEYSPADGGGLHRYCRAWASLDLTRRYRSGNRLPPSWYGIHCGVRPVEFTSVEVNRTRRTYCMSHDADGTNRIYEVSSTAADDLVDGRIRRVRSMIQIGPFRADGRTNAVTKPKIPEALRLDIEDARGNVDFRVRVRGGTSGEWAEWGTANVAPDEQAGDCYDPPEPKDGAVSLSKARESLCGSTDTRELGVQLDIEGHVRVTATHLMFSVQESQAEADARRVFSGAKTHANCDAIELYDACLTGDTTP